MSELPSRRSRAEFAPRLPHGFECSLAAQLAARLDSGADTALVVNDDGAVLSVRQVYHSAVAIAGRLRALGLKRADRVAIWLPNSADMLATLFACSMIGAVAVQLNIGFRGSILSQALRISGARLMVAHGELIERLAQVELGQLELVVTRQAATPVDGVRIEPLVVDGPPPDVELETLHPWDLAAIVFTSGTTGPSKGVRVTTAQLWTIGQAFYGDLDASDRMLLVLPLFHIASLGALWGAMSAGASLALTEAFSPASFWEVVRKTGATTNTGMPERFLDLLSKAPPSGADRDHTMRLMMASAISPRIQAFAERFGVDVFAGYNMSETSVVTISAPGATKAGGVGRVRKGIDWRLVDANDIEVGAGQPGELIIRADLPWVLNDGYENAAEATVRAWRNGWFHTGDLFVADEDGDLFFKDRLKDMIRRRGENISSAELESEVRAYPNVLTAAAVGVETEGGEEVLLAVLPRPGEHVDPAELVHFLLPRLPHYMIPRFIRLLPELPLTETGKVQKAALREAGVAADVWDREAAGLAVRRHRFRPD